jgi:hypothetical protein
MNGLSSALAILSAMITPAVLISACAALTISTSARLARVMERTRRISEKFGQLLESRLDGPLLEEERSVFFRQLNRATRRSRLLQRAMTSLYLALSVFIGTSVAIGIVAVVDQRYAWIPILLGILGAGLLLHSSLLLILDSRIALSAVDDEMDFILRLTQLQAPAELVKLQQRRRWLFLRRKRK